VEKQVMIQTQEKHTVGFGQTTACIDFRPVALNNEGWYDFKRGKSAVSIKIGIITYSLEKLKTLLYNASSIQFW